jgi:flagellar motor component MotA
LDEHLEEELGLFYPEDFFRAAMLLVVDGTCARDIRQILETIMEREHDFYKKNLMRIAMEGVMGIQGGEETAALVFRLNSMVAIDGNPIDTARGQFLSGDKNALLKVDFNAAQQPEQEREEVRFIIRAIELSEIARRRGLAAVESHLDAQAVASRDILEYGLSRLASGGIDASTEQGQRYMDGVFAEMEGLRANDPVQKNFALAKKTAVLGIGEEENPRLLRQKLFAFFDIGIIRSAKQSMLHIPESELLLEEM